MVAKGATNPNFAQDIIDTLIRGLVSNILVEDLLKLALALD